MNKEISDALHFLLHCALKDDEFETQREQFEIIYKYIENLEQENQELKKQLEEKQNPLKEIFAQVNDDTLLRNCGAMQSEIDEYKNQQKQFIEYLENEISNFENVIAEIQEKSYYYNNDNLKEELTEKSQKSYQKRILLEEVLSKYYETIGNDINVGSKGDKDEK